MKIVFLGTPRFAQIVLEKLANTPYKPHLVITGHERKSGRGLASKATEVKLAAEKHGIKVFYELSGVDDTFDLAILVAYGKIIPKNILEIPRFGFLNVHPSLLPKYRGPSPIQTAILEGETKSGVTIMKLDEQLDHGPILSQKEVEIKSSDTHSTLIEKLGSLGAGLLLETLPLYLEHLRGGSKLKPREHPVGVPVFLPPKDQDHTKATFTKKITKRLGLIDMNMPQDKTAINRMIRAFYPWPNVWFEVDGKKFKLLPENKIQPEGKNPMNFSEFKNGYKNVAEKIILLIN